jgi:polysaccharide deacetylase family protein (PEP-CTERM system associated)
MTSAVVNALSIDVEEYYHATVFQEAVKGTTAGLESRVQATTERILAILAARGVRATFFVLGEVGDRHPVVVRRIAQEGHEIACHGYDHTLVSQLSPEEFRADVHRSKAVLEEVGGQSVVGYRAPSFSIGPGQRWAYQILAEEGFGYDSSVYPILHDRYGDRMAPRFPYEIWRRGYERLIEVPIGTVRLLGLNLPVGGGGYFRLLPGRLISAGIRRVNAAEGRPIVFYVHPWELDPDQPQPPMAWHRRLRLCMGQRRHEAKLKVLLERVTFGTVREVLDRFMNGAAAPQGADAH